LNGHNLDLPQGVHLTGHGPDWIRYRADKPEQVNPLILRGFLDRNLPVISLQEVPRSLEQVYLQAINTPEDEVVPNVH
jgi:ABC-2 type transport system ATP-binding protein